MNFIAKNYYIIARGIDAMYSSPRHKVGDKYYLSTKQIYGIMEYLEGLVAEDDANFDVMQFIDDVIGKGYGFDEEGRPIEPEEA